MDWMKKDTDTHKRVTLILLLTNIIWVPSHLQIKVLNHSGYFASTNIILFLLRRTKSQVTFFLIAYNLTLLYQEDTKLQRKTF